MLLRRVDRLMPGMIVRLPDGAVVNVESFPEQNGDRVVVRFGSSEVDSHGLRLMPDDLLEIART